MEHFAGVLKTSPPKNLGRTSGQLCSLVTKDSTIHRMKNQICNTFPAQCQNTNAMKATNLLLYSANLCANLIILKHTYSSFRQILLQQFATHLNDLCTFDAFAFWHPCRYKFSVNLVFHFMYVFQMIKFAL